jgi:hypothetical protein
MTELKTLEDNLKICVNIHERNIPSIVYHVDMWLDQTKKHILKELGCDYSIMVEMCFQELKKRLGTEESK